MKASKKSMRWFPKSVAQWSIGLVLGLVVTPGNELMAIHSRPENLPKAAMVSPCDAMGSLDYSESVWEFKNLPIKEKRQVLKKNKHLMKEYKSRCPEQYKLIKKQASLIFWTDVWHVAVGIVLLPVALTVGILALGVYLFLDSLDDE